MQSVHVKADLLKWIGVSIDGIGGIFVHFIEIQSSATDRSRSDDLSMQYTDMIVYTYVIHPEWFTNSIMLGTTAAYAVSQNVIRISV